MADNDYWLESQKQGFEILKHITTLDTGSILILTTFAEKFTKEPASKELLASAFVGFIVSILASVMSMVFGSFVLVYRNDRKNLRYHSLLSSIGFGLSLGGFYYGIVQLIHITNINF